MSHKVIPLDTPLVMLSGMNDYWSKRSHSLSSQHIHMLWPIRRATAAQESFVFNRLILL